MQGRMNIPTHDSGGSEVELNVFAQATEPATKKGIWINTSASGSLPLIEKFEYDGIEITNVDFHGQSNGSKVYFPNNQVPYEFYHGAVTAVGTDIYLFGSYSSGYQKYAYKYNTITGTYTRLTNIPYAFYYGAVTAVGTDIYLFGGYSSNTQKCAYKYNTITGTYTRLTDIPYEFYYGAVTTVGTEIYLFGTYPSSYQKYAYKYKTTIDAYIRLAGVPYEFYGGAVTAVGTDIYLFGTYSSGYSKYAYKYNTTTGTYTRLTDVPYAFYHGAVTAVGTDIYLFGGNSSKENNYLVTDIQLKNNYIYLFAVYRDFKTQISNNVNIPVKYAHICQNNTLQNYPAYYGDGTQWNRLPN